MLYKSIPPMSSNEARKTPRMVAMENVKLVESAPVEVSKRLPKCSTFWKEKILLEAERMRSCCKDVAFDIKASKSLRQDHPDSHVLIVKDFHESQPSEPIVDLPYFLFEKQQNTFDQFARLRIIKKRTNDNPYGIHKNRDRLFTHVLSMGKVCAI